MNDDFWIVYAAIYTMFAGIWNATAKHTYSKMITFFIGVAISAFTVFKICEVYVP